MLKEELLNIEEGTDTPGRDNHDTETSPSKEKEDLPFKSKRQKKDTLLLMFSEKTVEFNSHCTYASYLREPVIGYKDGNPFIWWSQHKADFCCHD